jgi:hypothetical protein
VSETREETIRFIVEKIGCDRHTASNIEMSWHRQALSRSRSEHSGDGVFPLSINRETYNRVFAQCKKDVLAIDIDNIEA